MTITLQRCIVLKIKASRYSVLAVLLSQTLQLQLMELGLGRQIALHRPFLSTLHPSHLLKRGRAHAYTHGS